MQAQPVQAASVAPIGTPAAPTVAELGLFPGPAAIVYDFAAPEPEPAPDYDALCPLLAVQAVNAIDPVFKTEDEWRVEYRARKVGTLPDAPGCYVLIDARNEVLYVGSSEGVKEGIRKRAQRHLTGARSDIIACDLFHPDEAAFVVPFVCHDPADVARLEAWLYSRLNPPLNQRRLELTDEPPPGVTRLAPVRLLPWESIREMQNPKNYRAMLRRRLDAIEETMLTVKSTAALERTADMLFDRLTAARKLVPPSGAVDGEQDDETY